MITPRIELISVIPKVIEDKIMPVKEKAFFSCFLAIQPKINPVMVTG